MDFREAKSHITNDNNYIHEMLGQGNNYKNEEESFLELPNKLDEFQYRVNKEVNNNFTQHICSKCNIPKPSARLLDIHIQEDHDDILFKLLSERQPMYECYVENCDLKFNSSAERNEHCFIVHKYAKGFGRIVKHEQHECEQINKTNEQWSHKRKNVDDFQDSKRRYFDTDSRKISEQSKSTIAFVPRQLLLDKFSKMDITSAK